ncbi:MAG: hypothetical protein HFH34_07990 [Eubacterium sp.]|nr:hypothetical protein [Eubacterium sp.]
MHMTRDSWKDFALSGRVSDYLKYREQENRSSRQGAAVWTGGASDGTDNRADGHGIVSNACR